MPPALELPAEATYYLERGETTDEVPAHAAVDSVRIRYYCPKCDKPNAIGFSLPAPGNYYDECDHCENPLKVLNGQGTFEAEDIPAELDRLDMLRRSRLIGQQATVQEDSKVWEAKVSTLLGAVLFGALGLSVPYVGLTTFEVSTMTGLFHVHIATFAMLMLSVLCLLSRQRMVGAIFGVKKVDLDMYSHGREVEYGDAELYTPPAAREAEEREREVVTNRR